MTIHLEILVRNALLLGRPVFHKPMTVVIDGVVIDRRKIPRFTFQKVGGSCVNRGTFRGDLHNRGDSTVVGLIDFRAIGNKREDILPHQLQGVDSERTDFLKFFRRVDTVGSERPSIPRFFRRFMEKIRNHCTPNRLGGVTGPPPHNHGPLIVLV